MSMSLLHIVLHSPLSLPLHTLHTHILTDPRAANSPSDSPSDSPVHWEFIAAGTCGTVLLLAVVVLVGIATYAYRHKQKQRQRRCVLNNISDGLYEWTDRPRNFMTPRLPS